MINRAYLDAVRLLLDAAPSVFRSTPFALKGGSAINLFLRNMPRLSVDLDLVFTDHRPNRREALDAISRALETIRPELARTGLQCETGASPEGDEVKLFVRRGRTRIKIEVNHVFRGVLLPPVPRPLCAEAQNTFFTDLEIPVIHPDELYGGKLVAAMDRQHPRDLYDILKLLDGGGPTDGIVECFVCYLAGHNRPVHEVLFANEIDISQAFSNEFAGMAREPADLDDLLNARRELFARLPAALEDRHRNFLVGLVEGAPDWSLIRFGHLREMPAIRWKLANLERLRRTNPGKFASQSSELKRRFGF